MIISIIGIGFVGSAMKQSFEKKNIKVKCYDKFKNIGTLEDCLESQIMFLCLPTQFNEEIKEYDKSCIIETCDILTSFNYNGLVVIKSPVESETTEKFSKKYKKLKFIHNPEFLSAATAYYDFHNQKHIVIGKGPNVSDNDIEIIREFYSNNYSSDISICSSSESESMKLFTNCFYSVKIQFFNELFLLCNETNNCEYNNVVSLMIKNGWINKMHTQVPGSDGKLSYGGYCFPKDTNALLNLMKSKNVPCNVLDSTIKERNNMRNDNVNIIKKKKD